MIPIGEFDLKILKDEKSQKRKLHFATDSALLNISQHFFGCKRLVCPYLSVFVKQFCRI